MSWKYSLAVFAAVFLGVTAGLILLVLGADPYGLLAPLRDRDLQYGNQRTLYPQIVRSHRYRSFIVGTSTSRLLDPEILDQLFASRFANLAMNSMMAWEQKQMLDLVLRETAKIDVLLIGVDGVWCNHDADRHRVLKEGFPDWLYDDRSWNDFLYLLNIPTVKLALRTIGYRLGLVAPQVRADGFGVFVPPESAYDPAKARAEIWRGRTGREIADLPPPPLGEAERRRLRYPALDWMDDVLARLPPTTRKLLVFMPVHVAAQPLPGSTEDAEEAECKARIRALARQRDATVVDWRIRSPLTREDTHYWDHLHVRLPVAARVARDTAAAVLEGRPSDDRRYRLYLPGTAPGRP